MNSLSIAIPMQKKKLHWFNDSISVLSLSMNLLEIWLTHSIYDTTLPKFFRSGLTFHEALLTCKISGWLTSSLLRYSCFFQNSAIWLPIQLQIFRSPFTFLQSMSAYKTITVIDWIALEIWLVYKSCNLIGWEQNLQNIFYVSWIYICMPIIKLIYQILLEI